MMSAFLSSPGLPVRTCGRAVALIAYTLTAIGVVMIYSASTIWGVDKFGDPAHFLKRQLASVAMGTVLFFACARLDPSFWRRHAGGFLLLTAGLLVLVLIFGSRFNGARRWLRFLGFGFQPSELAKIAVVVVSAAFLSRQETMIRDFRRGFLPALLPIVLLCGLTVAEPDFGTALFLGALGVMVLVVGGLRLSHLLLTAAAVLPAVTFLMWSRFEYIQQRLSFFAGAETSYQVKQGFIAMGSGGLIGRGIGAGKGKLFFLPEVAGDFIFPALGEEIGFLGVLLVILLFMALCWFGYRIARAALGQQEPFAFYLALGVTAFLGMQALTNMAVVSGSAPTKGIALPFISYGGSSIVVGLAGVGILVGIARSIADRTRIDLMEVTS
jgi:cell division protein FtsW